MDKLGPGPGRYLRPGHFTGYRLGGRPNPTRFSGGEPVQNRTAITGGASERGDQVPVCGVDLPVPPAAARTTW